MIMENLRNLAYEIAEIGQLEDIHLHQNGNSYSFLVLGPDNGGVLKLLEAGRLVWDRYDPILEVWNTNEDKYEIFHLSSSESVETAAHALKDMSDDLGNKELENYLSHLEVKKDVGTDYRFSMNDTNSLYLRLNSSRGRNLENLALFGNVLEAELNSRFEEGTLEVEVDDLERRGRDSEERGKVFYKPHRKLTRVPVAKFDFSWKKRITVRSTLPHEYPLGGVVAIDKCQDFDKFKKTIDNLVVSIDESCREYF